MFDPAALAALPAELVSRLEQASVQSDSDAVDRIIEEIRVHDVMMADMLA